MTVRANMFTPEVLLSAPRRSAGVPNADATSVLYTTSTYSFSDHDKTIELRCLNTSTDESTLLVIDNKISEPVWLEGEKDVFVCLKSGDKGSTSIVVSEAHSTSAWDNSYVAGEIEAPASSLKIAKLGNNSYAVVVAAQSLPDGSLYNPETAPKTHSTGKLYKSLFVRHWDAYIGKERSSLWYGTLTKGDGGKWKMSGLVNALKDTPLESPVQPFGGTDNFDVGQKGIIFVAKDPDLNPALETKCNAYYIELSTFTEKAAPKPSSYTLPGFRGASTSPVFAPGGKRAAFLSMPAAGYEADKNQIFLIEDVKTDSVECLLQGNDKGRWDRSPQALAFSHDGESLYCLAEEDGYGRLFQLPSKPKEDELPQRLTEHGYVSSVRPLSTNSVFITASSLVDYTYYGIIEHDRDPAIVYTHSATKNGSSLGLKASQVASIHTPASNTKINKTVHSWVVRPSTYSAGSSKKYPLAMLIHGGPQGSWADSWSTRWNPATYAEQGYIVVAPNPTGSTGYGQAFTDAIRNDWGGAPYEDIVNCFEWVEKNMPEVDISRAVALGASYGGYMVNWIQGHDLGRKFKALVCHDGIFSTTNLLSTEELYFPFTDLGGAPWRDLPPSRTRRGDQTQATFGKTTLDAWAKNDPSRFLDQWQTPELVIHNSKDYRLCISEGLSAFNVLQARGVESQFLTFPDENHWVLKPENSLVWHKAVLNWINGYVGLPLYCAEDEDDDEFFGGIKKEDGETVEMAGMGKPET